MGPKKKGKKDKGGGETDGMKLGEDDQLKKLQQESLAMQVQRNFDTEVKANAEATARELKMRMADVNRRYEEEKTNTYEITRDMTRQYKDMQETLVSKINQLEGTIQELKDELETNRATFQQKLRAKEKVIGDQEEEIKDMKSKMEGMAAEFGDMLKKTLDKMKERIELNSANFEEQSVPINKRLEEFNLKD
ncbi:hypothetical protein TrVE_jg10093 [Triparma verrucosa]|uniref:Dynein regulatory complex protein 12 n=2 Tax=Triparma TaxID=722752 RepID=A0A9W7B5M6_9STRA|nr:hypothetical protein TrST_g712 [Triparma strigata]GMI06196.1 hypothetical protein TrVE_jg10093 [Triparma verrucosa]